MISPMLYILLSVDGLEMSILMTPFTHGRYPHSTNLPSWGSRAIEPSSSLRLIGESISRTTPSFRARRLSQRFFLSCCDLVICFCFLVLSCLDLLCPSSFSQSSTTLTVCHRTTTKTLRYGQCFLIESRARFPSYQAGALVSGHKIEGGGRDRFR